MKTLRLIGMAIMAVIMSVNFAACSDDDDEETSNPLLGTWRENTEGDQDYNIWTFKSGGTGLEYNYYQGKLDGTYSFTYTYDNATSTLIVNYGGEIEYGKDDIDRYHVTISGNTMTTKDIDYGYETIWTKKKD